MRSALVTLAAPGRVAVPFERVRHVLVGAVVVGVSGLVYWRLFYGVDFTDESFYVAVPYRFVLGARPFVDETSVTQQTAGILLYPFVRAYAAAAGTTGLVLFVRHLHYLFSLVVGWAVFASLRRFSTRDSALLTAIAAVAFVPFQIPSLSYDTLASGLFTAGCLLAVAGATPGARLRMLVLAGLCEGLAAFAYPPLALVVVAAAVGRTVFGSPRSRLLAYALPAVVTPALGFGLLASSAGLHTVVADFRHSSRYLGQGGGLGKLDAVAAHELTAFRFWYLVPPALLLLAALSLIRRSLAAWATVGLPLLAWPPNPAHYSASLEFVAHFGWFALPLFLVVRRRAGARELLLGAWLPALAAGLTTAYSSSNGGINFGLGFFPATIVSTLFLAWTVEEALPGKDSFWPRTAAGLAGTALLAFFVAIPVYRDAAVSTLDTRVDVGPFAGLMTSRRKEQFVDGLQRDLSAFPSGCKILFFNDFPAGYLLAAARPDTNSAWTATVAADRVHSYQDALISYYRRRGFPDVVVVMRRIPYAPSASARIEHDRAGEPLLVMLRTHSYRRAVTRFDYVVYRRGSATCPLHPGGSAVAASAQVRAEK